MSTSTDLLVLHALRCVGASSLERLADVTGLPETDVQTELIDLAVEGSATRDEGPFGGWRITDAGKAAHATRIADELDASGEQEVVAAAYDTFLVLNPQVLDICTAWQTREIGGVMVVNDHADAAYDVGILDRLNELHRRAERICDDLTVALPRFGRYAPRLVAALERANAGEVRAVADDMASYHTVWFELHEDLLVTLGLQRES